MQQGQKGQGQGQQQGQQGRQQQPTGAAQQNMQQVRLNPCQSPTHCCCPFFAFTTLCNTAIMVVYGIL